jgi:hypothetical protein
MNKPADLLLLTSLVHPCADCGDERIFVVVEGSAQDRGEYCCTYCGAAVVIDPTFDSPTLRTRLAS